MAPGRSPDESGSAPDLSDPFPLDDDVIISEHGPLRHRLPNQHDLDSDDDQAIWNAGAAPWLDLDDLEDAVWPGRAPEDGPRPAPGI